jgi:hypothetical protein
MYVYFLQGKAVKKNNSPPGPVYRSLVPRLPGGIKHVLMGCWQTLTKKTPAGKPAGVKTPFYLKKKRLELHAQVMAEQENVLGLDIAVTQLGKVANCPPTEMYVVGQVLVQFVCQTNIELPAV